MPGGASNRLSSSRSSPRACRSTAGARTSRPLAMQCEAGDRRPTCRSHRRCLSSGQELLLPLLRLRRPELPPPPSAASPRPPRAARQARRGRRDRRGRGHGELSIETAALKAIRRIVDWPRRRRAGCGPRARGRRAVHRPTFSNSVRSPPHQATTSAPSGSSPLQSGEADSPQSVGRDQLSEHRPKVGEVTAREDNPSRMPLVYRHRINNGVDAGADGASIRWVLALDE